ncbi:MAG: TIGR01212 family radical SAM protein [Bdellovibrio sp.]|nr:TIGR01212 family radical SAM protein [Bdellovibrio sp.]
MVLSANSRRPIFFYKEYLVQRFEAPVYKVSIDAGMTCPNRDGSLGVGGCSYCSNPSFSKKAYDGEIDLQIKQSLQRYPVGTKFIAYLQSYSNTYASVPHLREIYTKVLNFPGMVGLNIGTRPDCLQDDVLSLLNEFSDKFEVMLEIGLESFSDDTLRRVNRGHTVADFYNAVERVKKLSPKVKLATHLMIGFPWEEESFWVESGHLATQLPIDMLKLHNLIVVNKTALGEEYKRQAFPILSKENYMRIAADFLAQLSPQISIGRCFAYTTAEHLIAPAWVAEARSFHGELEQFMRKNQLYQGKFSILPT